MCMTERDQQSLILFLLNSYKICGILSREKGRNRPMNITSKGRYALRVMLDLAQHPDDGFVSLKVAAERQDISLKYLEMIIAHLKRAGLVESTRGKDGGYRLTREPAAYSIGEILNCIEDNLAPVACIQDGSVHCDQAGACLTIPMWKELDDITNRYLSSVTLQDLLTGEKWKR